MKQADKKCCPFLDRTGMSCNADAEPYIPNSFELRQYCRKREHEKCPFFLNLHVWTFLNSTLF